MLEEVNQVLNLTLKRQISMHRSERLIFIKDEYIRITDLMKDSANPHSFSSILKSGRIRHIKVICIFALKTIFIDEDLNLPGLNLGIIAPKWEIVGERKINLKGADGEHHSAQKANDGRDEGSNGADGKPGLPGKSGGSFFGIGATFVNGAYLTINTNGGNGAPGQDGGNGQKGENGVDAEMPTTENSPSQDIIVKGLTSFKDFECKRITGKGWINSKTYDATFEIIGKPSLKGGNGGNGGKGGEGGHAGVINLYELAGHSDISLQSEKGTTGADGRGGESGKGGDKGDKIVANCHIKNTCCLEALFGGHSTIEWTRIKTLLFPKTSGNNGISGKNRNGLQSPEPANIISEPFKIVNEYKKYLMRHFSCRFKTFTLGVFFKMINENNNIQSITNTIGLVEEFQMIEDEYFRSSIQTVNFIPIYQSLLRRVWGYKESLCQITQFMLNHTVYVKVLKYLVAAIMSKISLLSDITYTNVIDIKSYLDKIKRSIIDLNEPLVETQHSYLISKQKQDYDHNVSKRLDEIQSFLVEKTLPKIKIFREEIDNGVHLLVKTNVQLQNHAASRDYIVMKQHEVEDLWALKQVFGNIKLISETVNFLCKIAILVGPIIKTLTSVTYSDEDQNVINFLQAFEKGISDVTNDNLEFLHKCLEDMSNELENCPEPLQDFLSVIEEIKNKLDVANRKPFTLMEAKALESELKLELKKNEEKIKSEEGDHNLMALQIIRRFNKIADLGSSVFYIDKNDEHGDAKLCELHSASEQDRKKFLRLKKIEENIYVSIDQIIKNIKDNSFDSGSQTSASTNIALDVKEWQAQGNLKNIQLQMKELYEEVKADNKVSRCFNILQEVMNGLIKAFDDIQNYGQQQKLANSISDISSVVLNVNINDEKLVKIVDKLNITLKANLILKNYKMALDAFNQWVFPFSLNYINNSMLLNHFKPEGTIDNLIGNCVTYVEHMKTKIDVYKSSVMINGSYFLQGEFNCHSRIKEPFFIWKSEDYQHSFSKLLSGDEIALNANVKKSSIDKNAIKFSFIEFQFRCKKLSLQPNLDQILKNLQLTATHTGNSYYRLKNKIFLVASESQSIVYSFDKNASRENISSDSAYEKLRNGDLMLSPYTVWKLKLTDSTNGISFDELKKFEEIIDLELVGYASYVTNAVPLSLAEDNYRILEEYAEFYQCSD